MSSNDTSVRPGVAPPAISLPKDGETCSVSAINTTCYLTVPSETLVEPVIPGHELMNFPTIAFLITNSASKKQVLFDLGCRKDFWNLPPPIAEVIDTRVPGIKVDDSLVDILRAGGVEVEKLTAAIVSHHHYDHVGNPSTFPRSMKLLVGPGFIENFLPGYPGAQDSPAFEAAFQNRDVREVTFDDGLMVAGFRAHDYFKDGSLYILDSPGHAIGHLSALVRTTKDTFIFLGGDICHFGGSFRPTESIPMPPTFSAEDVGLQEGRPAPYPRSLFTSCHPHSQSPHTTPYYQPCSHSGSWYVDPPLARRSIGALMALDSDERVMALIAHDPSIMSTLPLFPNGTLDDWYAKSWKAKMHWRFLDELPVDGKQKRFLVDGTYRDGKLVKRLDGTRDDDTSSQ